MNNTEFAKYIIWLDEDKKKCIGNFNQVIGIEKNVSTAAESENIRFYDGFIGEEFQSIRKLKSCDLIIEFYDLNNQLLHSFEGVALEVNLLCSDKASEIEIHSNSASSLFIRQGALNLWEERRAGLLERSGSWIDLNNYDRESWLEVNLFDRRNKKYSSVNEDVELNGSVITDLISFLCAFGECINGPGGYMGRCLSALDDCLNGTEFHNTLPKNLIWKNSNASKKSFQINNQSNNFDGILSILRDAKINVILD